MSRGMEFDDTYVESQVILTTVKLVAPFVLTYGLFLALHGADTPGGSFQGGAIIGVTILMLAFAFGIEPTRQWVRNGVLVALVGGGVAIFIGVGLATMALGGAFLEYRLFEEVLGIPDGTKWGMEAIEVGGIALIVAGVFIGVFFATASGFSRERRFPVGRLESDGGAGDERDGGRPTGDERDCGRPTGDERDCGRPVDGGAGRNGGDRA